jgi:hypothetical protein
MTLDDYRYALQFNLPGTAAHELGTIYFRGILYHGDGLFQMPFKTFVVTLLLFVP